MAQYIGTLRMLSSVVPTGAASDDYTPLNDTLEFDHDSSMFVISMNLTDDVIDEPTEIYFLQLSLVHEEDGTVVLEPSTAMVTIQDNDSGCG